MDFRFSREAVRALGMPERRKRARHSSPIRTTVQSASENLVSLPVEVLAIVIDYLGNWSSRMSVRLVSKKWATAVLSLLEDELQRQLTKEGRWVVGQVDEAALPILVHSSRMSTFLLKTISGIDLSVANFRGNQTATALQSISRTFSGLTNLKSLFLAKGYVTDDLLGAVARVRSLEALHIPYSRCVREKCFKHLAKLTNVRVFFLSLSYVHVNAEHLMQLSKWNHLEALDLYGFRCFTTAQMSTFIALFAPTLKSLNLSGCLDAAPVAGLESLKLLEALDLTECPLDKCSFSFLNSMPFLRRLKLKSCDVQDGGVAAISAAAPQLTFLNLADCRSITDAGAAHVATMRPLEVLDLTNTCKISGAAFAVLSKLSSLKELYLPDCSVSDAGFLMLTALVDLLRLDVSNTSITEAGLTNVTRLTSLRELSVQFCDSLTDTNLIQFAKILTLEKLNLAYSKVTNKGLKGLSGLPRLESLCLEGCSCLTEHFAAELVVHSTLNTLELRNLDFVSDVTLKDLGKIQSLTSLTLPSTDITDSGVVWLTGLFNLRKLSMAKCKQLANRTAQSLSTMPQLTYLDVEGCGITDAGLEFLAALPRLTYLGVVDCYLTHNSLERLLKKKKRLVIIT
jgi:Leucine-rich repeat (LRR) protein